MLGEAWAENAGADFHCNRQEPQGTAPRGQSDMSGRRASSYQGAEVPGEVWGRDDPVLWG